MAARYTQEQLEGLDKDILITLFLGLQEQMEQVSKNLEVLTEQITIMNQKRFGRSSEKGITEAVNGQGYLKEEDGELTAAFNEIETLADPMFVEPDCEEVVTAVVRKTPKQKGKREADLSGFPHRIIRHELSDDELRSRLGDRWKQLPDEVYKRLTVKPAVYEVEEHHVAVYAAADGQTVIRADRPADLLRNSIVTPSLEAAVINAKYVNALPLYRIEQEFQRCGMNISRQTMANWTIQCGERYLGILYDYLHEKLYGHHVLQADETTVLVSKDGRPAGSKSYMWIYRTGQMEKEPIILYEYQKTRSQSHPSAFLNGFSGVLVTDGYQVYHSLETRKEDLVVAGCWSHARRHFADVVKTFKKKDDAKKTLAYQALKQIQAMYKIEESLAGLSGKDRQAQRQLSIRPLVDAFFTWLKVHQQDVLEKSATGKGISYCLNQERYLRYFLEDGEVPMDNNASERAIRGFCIGRKNWVMIDTVAGAQASAIIYSIVETARANNIRPYQYIEHLLTEIPKHMDETDRSFLDDLLPWSENLPAECKK